MGECHPAVESELAENLRHEPFMDAVRHTAQWATSPYAPVESDPDRATELCYEAAVDLVGEWSEVEGPS